MTSYHVYEIKGRDLEHSSEWFTLEEAEAERRRRGGLLFVVQSGVELKRVYRDFAAKEKR